MLVKTKKRILSMVMILCLFHSIIIAPACVNAYDYSLTFPSTFLNSMRYTGTKLRNTSLSPYVQSEVATISTMYFLSPNMSGSTQATNVVYISAIARKYFTWKSGYGGSGQKYCLAACPNPDNGSWNIYTAEGIWIQ